MQTQSAHDYTYWKQGMNPDVLDAFPAQRFIRERDVKTPRPVHQQNEGVVQLKSDLPFWLAMNDPAFGGFGVPYGPWGFNSGMGVEDEDRETAEGLGLLQPGQKVQPVEQAFNDHLQASTRGLDADMVAKLKSSFGKQVEFDEDSQTARWVQPDREEPAVKLQPEVPRSRVSVISPDDEEPQVSLADVLSDLDLDGDRAAAANDMRDLRDGLKEEKPAPASRMVKFIQGAQPAGALSDANIEGAVQEFLDFIPPATLARLPKLQITVKRMGDLGSYGMGGRVSLNASLLAENPDRMRATLFHELMHWLHREGPQSFRDAIQEHFDERTAGERLKQLTGYARGVRGMTDDWWDSYAGRVYPFELPPSGLEVPTRYIEWLTWRPEKMAEYWNDPKFRGTMKIVLGGLFQ